MAYEISVTKTWSYHLRILLQRQDRLLRLYLNIEKTVAETKIRKTTTPKKKTTKKKTNEKMKEM